ncbi:MAG: hypothetical protein ACLP3C_01675 [Mycobacterium sp.]|uniref:hypothetical protein n=1 Tax=Mycobacterium sp. TaxID=1785 RepID=UPI003C48120F
MGEQDSERTNEPADQENGGNSEQTPQEKPEPDEEDKEKAAEMKTAYVDKPTLVLPGSGGAISGTAVGDWLDDDGNPKYANDEDAPAAKAKVDGDDKDDGETDEHDFEEQVEKDKKFNEAVIKAAKEREDAEAGDKDKAGKAEASEDHKAVSK